MPLEGGCFCGAIRYRLARRPSPLGLCHCETCRRIASAPSLPFAMVARADFAILQGRPVRFRSSPAVERSFCGTCGSPLTYANDATPDSMDVMTCSLDDADALPPDYSVWTGAKLAWDVPNPTCPFHPRGADAPAA